MLPPKTRWVRSPQLVSRRVSSGWLGVAMVLAMVLAIGNPASIASAAEKHASLKAALKTAPFKIAYESYAEDNWEIFVMAADGSGQENLTRTPGVHEHYPQVSPDGTKLCYSVDEGEGREAVRSLWVMDVDGRNRRKLAEGAREPFWSPDGTKIGFLPQEYPKFNVIDFFTKGMSFCHLADGRIEPHPNSTNLHHLYNPGFSSNGRWIVATVHAGMGVEHGILLIEANGHRILNLNIPGCRPCLSPDGKQIAWGSGDHEIAVAPLDTDAETPVVGPWRLRIQDRKQETYHVDWSPDGRFLSLSRGPASKGDPTKKGTFLSACEIVGVYAPGWDIHAVSAEENGVIHMESPDERVAQILTTNGASNKESAWFKAPSPGKGR